MATLSPPYVLLNPFRSRYGGNLRLGGDFAVRCRFCGISAGWFKSEHFDCRKLNKTGFETVCELVAVYAVRRQNMDVRSLTRGAGSFEDSATFDDILCDLLLTSYNNHRKQEILKIGVSKAIADINPDDLSKEVQTNIWNTVREYIPGTFFPDMPFEILRMKVRLNDLRIHGDSLSLDGTSSDSAQGMASGEVPVWTFRNVVYCEEKTRYSYESRSSGVSFRVVKGVTVRVGQSQGRRTEQTALERVDTGSLTVTNRQFHFQGARKAFRVRFDKLGAIYPYDDCVTLIRDSTSARPQVFYFENAWFVGQMLQRLS